MAARQRTEEILSAQDKNRGRQQAQRAFEATACASCGRTDGRLERHHRDDNPLNNAPENVVVLCTRCHMEADGRLAALRARVADVQAASVVVNRKWKGTTCSVDGCDRPAKYKALCNTHYSRMRATGSPGPAAIRRYRSKP